ncbi:MAG: hypothetical protein ACHQF2_10405 [Flavobacteriales bacterium]
MKKIYTMLCCGIMATNITYSQAENSRDLAMATALDMETDFVSPEVILNRYSAVDFNASVNAKKSVTITWTAMPAKAVAQFTILRSANGKSFSAWRTVQGTGSSSQQLRYLEIDEKPLPKATYYRLVQIEADGDSAYSEVRVVRTNITKKNSELEVYPYPAEADSGNTENNNDVLVVMQDSKGEMFYSRGYFKLEKGAISGISLHQALPAGTYVITASSKDELIGKTLDIK